DISSEKWSNLIPIGKREASELQDRSSGYVLRPNQGAPFLHHGHHVSHRRLRVQTLGAQSIFWCKDFGVIGAIGAVTRIWIGEGARDSHGEGA
ncbi:hypothetical protein U1Q18_027507, partial [Sarracenia purpurea var. burkii]